jgi:hypothetical protein
MNRDKLVLDSVLGGIGFTELSKKLGVSATMIREVFYRQVKRVMPEIFDKSNPSIKSLRLRKDEVKEKVYARLVSMDINTPDVHEQINEAIRLLVDFGYTVKKVGK